MQCWVLSVTNLSAFSTACLTQFGYNLLTRDLASCLESFGIKQHISAPSLSKDSLSVFSGAHLSYLFLQHQGWWLYSGIIPLFGTENFSTPHKLVSHHTLCIPIRVELSAHVGVPVSSPTTPSNTCGNEYNQGGISLSAHQIMGTSCNTQRQEEDLHQLRVRHLSMKSKHK